MTRKQFWDEFEQILTARVEGFPQDYYLRAGETPAQFAARSRASFERAADTYGIKAIKTDTETFRYIFRLHNVGRPFANCTFREWYLGLEG